MGICSNYIYSTKSIEHSVITNRITWFILLRKKKRDISNVSDSCHNLYKKCSLDIKEFGN